MTPTKYGDSHPCNPRIKGKRCIPCLMQCLFVRKGGVLILLTRVLQEGSCRMDFCSVLP